MSTVRSDSLNQYFSYLNSYAGRGTEMKCLLNEITVGETCFFRNRPQLEALEHVVFPSIVARKQEYGLHHLRIWSAGCSTGEEPYTLAIILSELGKLLQNWTFEILATDLNEESVRRAKEGVYGEYSLRNVKEEYLKKYFDRENEHYRVKRELRSHVQFSRVNLLDDRRMVFLKGMDLVLCCNVLIYFDTASKRRVIQHFFNNLLPNSYFFLGHAESLFGVTEDFKLVHFPGATGYLKLQRETVRA
ncbi:MAG TPA: protein-glutamate O-methyltransferase CheR [Terriglobales bacterium]|nr:protein-glutamate O-methyltransferase CheR [Terriglobales bacterium]